MVTHIGINAHLLAAQAGYRQAGIHTYIQGVLQHIPAVDPSFDYTVFVGEGTPPQPDRYIIQRSQFRTNSPIRRIIWEQALQPWQLGQYDLVHQMAFVSPLLSQHPFVVTVYDLTFMRYPERLPALRRLYLRWFTQLACRRAKRVIAISQSTADDVSTLLHVPRQRIDIAVPGIADHFRPLPLADVAAWRVKRGLPARFWLYLGTLEPRKNLTTLLHAYAALPASLRSEVHLILGGGRGWMVEALDRLIDDYQLTTVHRPGFIPDNELVWWYNAAEALVYPSVFEGWGMPITEAMACGTPVIVSDVSSLPEAAGHTGMRLPPTDVAAWTQALMRAGTDGAWRVQAGQQALQRAAQFTWRHTAEAIVASYKRALEIV